LSVSAADSASAAAATRDLYTRGLATRQKKAKLCPACGRRAQRGNTELNDLKTVFESIVATNAWGETESVSGAGSTLDYTHSLRYQLARFVRTFDIKTLFDAPCGDFNWMKEVSFPSHTRYIGADIAEPLIAANNRRHAGDWRRFLAFDLTCDAFPEADLWFCRDCLFHLPFAMIGRALRNFCASRIEFVMMTNHINVSGFHNR